MKRYALFIILTTNAALLSSTENAEVDKRIYLLFKKPFDACIVEPKKFYISRYPHLSDAEKSLLNNNNQFSNLCETHLKEVSSILSGTEEQILEDIKEEITFCLAELARIKKEDEYAKQMSGWFGFKPEYTEEAKKKLGQKEYTEVSAIFLQRGGFESMNLSHVFDSYSDKNVLGKFKNSCDLRLVSIRAREYLRNLKDK